MAKYILKRSLSKEQREYSRNVNNIIKNGDQWKRKDAMSFAHDKSEELAKELGERVRKGIMSAKAAKERLSRIRTASNNRVDLLRKAVNNSPESSRVDYVKPAGKILSRLENFYRTGAAFHGVQ